MESAESSNRIDGIVAPRERIQALVIENGAPRDQPEQEIAGYRDALKLVHNSARDMQFSVNSAFQLHSMLYRYHAGAGGRWKTAPNGIATSEAKPQAARVRFTPPAPVPTPQMMANVATSYCRAVGEGLEPLIAVPSAVFDFLCIHPFSEGNGRVSRLLTLQLLYQSDHDVGRYVSLERIVEDSKESYYEALNASAGGWHEGRHDLLPWLRYFWGMTLRAYREFEERVAVVPAGRGSKSDRVEQAVGRRVGAFAISDIESDVPEVTRDWIRMVLRRLKADGRIALQGRGRGAKWTVVENSLQLARSR